MDSPISLDLVCRTCLGTHNIFPILETVYSNVPVIGLLTYTVGICVTKNDKLAKNVCKTCLEELWQIYQFKTKCSRSQRKLWRAFESLAKAQAILDKENLKKSGELIRLEHSYVAKFPEFEQVNCNEITQKEEANTQTIDPLAINAEHSNFPKDIPRKEFHLAVTKTLKPLTKNELSNAMSTAAKMKDPLKSKAISNKCKTCSVGFSKLSYLQAHQKKFKHGQYSLVSCNDCGKIVPKFRIQKHKSIHQKSYSKECHKCSKSSITLTTCECVRRQDPLPVYYACLFCELRFKTFAEVRTHEKLHLSKPAKPFLREK